MASCPRCNSPTGATGKEWDYHLFHVKQYFCLTCQKTFMEYYRNGELSHTIPKGNGSLKYPGDIKRAVLSYFKRHKIVSIEKIAKELELSEAEVLETLTKMEKNGLIEKIDY